MENLGIIGVNMFSPNPGLLQNLTIPVDDRAEQVPLLKKVAGVDEFVYLATCNRVEFVYWASDGTKHAAIRNRILDFFFRTQPGVQFEPNDFYLKSGSAAVNHLFEVASSVNSLVIGEAQILGQVKASMTTAVELGVVGDNLRKLYARVYRVAKKVRNQTDLGKRSVSMISLVTGLIGQVCEREANVPVALIGVGEMTDKLARHLVERGTADLCFVNRTPEKTAEFVTKYGGVGMSLEQFLESPPPVRIICTATSSPTPIFTDDTLARFTDRNTPFLLIDLAMPPDVAVDKPLPEGSAIYGVLDLRAIADSNRKQRFKDLDKAHEIISTELNRFWKEQITEGLHPVCTGTYEQAHKFAERGLEELFEKTLSHLDKADREALHHWTEKLVRFSSYLPARTIADNIAAELDPAQCSGNFGPHCAHQCGGIKKSIA